MLYQHLVDSVLFTVPLYKAVKTSSEYGGVILEAGI